jgi:hypothetical protein
MTPGWGLFLVSLSFFFFFWFVLAPFFFQCFFDELKSPALPETSPSEKVRQASRWRPPILQLRMRKHDWPTAGSCGMCGSRPLVGHCSHRRPQPARIPFRGRLSRGVCLRHSTVLQRRLACLDGNKAEQIQCVLALDLVWELVKQTSTGISLLVKRRSLPASRLARNTTFDSNQGTA